MGLMDTASNKSFWRGVDYYKRKKVISYKKLEKNCYEGKVQGSNNDIYEVFVDELHPRKSTCTCAFASGRRVICKHMLAVYFTAESQKMYAYLDEIEREEQEREEEEERLRREHEQALIKKAKSMSKSDLIDELVLAWLRLEDYETNYYWG